MSDNLSNIPRWALIVATTVGLFAVGAIGTWAGSELRAATSKNHEQDVVDRTLEIRVTWLEASRQETNAKLDKIMERLGVRP